MSEENIKTRDFGNIYRLIYEKKQCSRQQIAEELGISLPTITHNLALLKEQELIYTSGTFNSTGGRKANMFRCVPNARYALGIDITRNHLSIVLINLNLDIIDSERTRCAFEDTSAYYENLQKKVEQFLNNQNLDTDRLLGIGISLPAIIESDQKTVFYATVISLLGNFYERISSCFPYPYLLFNDASSAGLAESWHANFDRPMLYLSLSNSVGGAFLNNGKIFPGANSHSSEFGHMCIVPHGKKCYCGCYGCLDAYCCAKVLSDFTGGNLAEFFKELSSGNPGYRRVFDDYLDYLAIAVNNLRMCYDCDVIIGGTVGSFMSDYLKDLRQKAIKLNPFEKSGNYILCCHYRTEASAVGAAAHYVDKFIKGM